MGAKKLTTPGFAPLRHYNLLVAVLQPIYISNKLYFGVRAIEITQNEERKREKVTSEVKECSRRKAQNGQAKNLHKEKDQHVSNSCHELRSRAINNSTACKTILL